jgi:hypothetical protein
MVRMRSGGGRLLVVRGNWGRYRLAAAETRARASVVGSTAVGSVGVGGGGSGQKRCREVGMLGGMGSVL